MAVFREGTNPVWGTFVLIWVLGSLGIDIYWLFTDGGPIGWLAREEGRLLAGHWLPKVTFLVVLLAQVGIALAVKIALERLTGKKLTAPVQRS